MHVEMQNICACISKNTINKHVEMQNRISTCWEIRLWPHHLPCPALRVSWVDLGSPGLRPPPIGWRVNGDPNMMHIRWRNYVPWRTNNNFDGQFCITSGVWSLSHDWSLRTWFTGNRSSKFSLKGPRHRGLQISNFKFLLQVSSPTVTVALWTRTLLHQTTDERPIVVWTNCGYRSVCDW